jgi:hypothetical protein
MAITNENGGLTGSDALAIMNATGGNRGGSNSFGNMFDGNNMWWIILLFIILGWNNNGNNANGGGYGMPYVINAGGFGGNDCGGVQAGFNQQAIMNGISGLRNSVSTGFGNAEVSRCNQQANVLQTLNANQNATIASMNSLAMGLQNCCCENKAGLADLKYTVATENCADRNSLSEGLYQLTAQMNANQNALVSMFNSGIREIKDEFCQDRLDRKDEIIAGLRQDLQNARFDASQVAQTARFDASQAAQTTALEQYLNPTAIPAYIVQNPNCCGNNGYYCNSCA